jgi:hypothetical protein
MNPECDGTCSLAVDGHPAADQSRLPHLLVLVEELDAASGLRVPLIPGHTSIIGVRFLELKAL